MAAPKKVKAKSKPVTAALHVQAGAKHVVGVKDLRVILTRDGNSWFAQGLEIDYAAAGASIEEAKENFGEGLGLTIIEHLTLNGNINKLLKIAPPEAWNEYLHAPPGGIKSYSTIVACEIFEEEDDKIKAKIGFPFENIVFLKSAELVDG